MILYIIGNGFDLAHKLDTKFSTFREYVKLRCEKITCILNEAEENYNKYFEKGSNEWSEFEEILKYINTKKIVVDIHSRNLNKHQLKSKIYKNVIKYEGFVESLNDMFHQWVMSINTDTPKYSERLLEQNDLFILNFNYINTIEKIII